MVLESGLLSTLDTMNNLLTESVVLEYTIFWPREREGRQGERDRDREGDGREREREME